MEFEIIYKKYWDKIFRVCMGYVNDWNLAQDMTQETFIKVWQYLPTFRNDADPGTWIFRIATNVCLRQLEYDKRFGSIKLTMDLAEEEKTDTEMQVRLLYKYISELPEIDRIIISLKLEDIRQSEIARIVGLSENNVRVKIHRIKTQLTKKFKENEK
ncbi:MAG: sigma-70 family RNA polymerase sigma factor [Tannerellaceae bacterium]|nr:sigma-70 family RNA polymerase sigma factor [Tannerellaceae bacterium]